MSAVFGFEISKDKSRLQLERIHRFLSQDAYWCEGIPQEVVAKAIEQSLCWGLYDMQSFSPVQVGFARVVTDSATFAWLCDVYVENEFRKKGLSKWLIDEVMDELKALRLRRVCLATRDAQALYERYDFSVTKTPSSWMEIKDNEIYKKRSQ